MQRITVGVDAGKTSHVAAMYDPAGDRVLGHLRFPVGRAGFERFYAFVRRAAGGTGEAETVLVGMEASGHYHLTLAEFLAARGYAVVLVNPYRAAQFRRALGKRAKTDRLDAQALARFLAAHAPAPEPAADEALARLRELTRFRAELTRDRTAAVNRLHAALDLVFPEFPALFGSLHRPTVLALLLAYPTAAALAGATPEAVRAQLRQASRGRLDSARADALVAAARTSIAVRSAAAAVALKVRALVRQLTQLNQELAELDAAIRADFAALGRSPADFPAGGVLTLAARLAEAGDVRRFASAKQFVAHFGWCPADRQSGAFKDAHPRLSKAGNRYVRRLLWMLAIQSVSAHGRPAYRAYFARRTAAGKNKMDTLVALGRKLLTTIYAILKTGRPYDPAYRPACLLAA